MKLCEDRVKGIQEITYSKDNFFGLSKEALNGKMEFSLLNEFEEKFGKVVYRLWNEREHTSI